jgi:hypothetical protein
MNPDAPEVCEEFSLKFLVKKKTPKQRKTKTVLNIPKVRLFEV